MPRGKKASAGMSLDALKARLKTQYDENVKTIDELKGMDVGEDDENMKKAIKLLRTPNLDIEYEVLPYIQVAVDKLKNKGRIGTKKPKQTTVAPTAGDTAPAAGAGQ